MDPYLKRAASGIATNKVVTGVPIFVSMDWKFHKDGLLDRQTDVVVPCKVNSKLYILHSGCVDNVGWKGSELAIS